MACREAGLEAGREAGLDAGREPLPVAAGASPGVGVLAGGFELSAAPAPALGADADVAAGALGADADVAASPPERLPLRGRGGGGAPPAVAASCSTSAFRSCASLCFFRASSANTRRHTRTT